MVYVYVLYSQVHHKHYVGMTGNLANRLKEHNAGKPAFTSAQNFFTYFTGLLTDTNYPVAAKYYF
jgi:predicted GIY-YIG superfamily endonuclease